MFVGVRHCVKVKFIGGIRHHRDPGEAESGVRVEKGWKKRCFYFHLGLFYISIHPDI